MIRIENISKQYDNHVALKNISLVIPTGCIFGLLGANGAGKTSLIRILTQIILPDSGQMYFFDELSKTHHIKWMGYLPEERGLYKKMKVAEQLVYLSQLKGLNKSESISNVNYWAQKLGFDSWKNKTIEELSKGMQQKVQFAAAVIHQPKFLILDEPFTGFDPLNAQTLIDVIYELKNQGVTIILSTHRMEQAELMCDEIAIIHQSELVLQGNLKQILNENPTHKYKISFSGEFPINQNLYHIINQNSDEVLVMLKDLRLNNTIEFLLPKIEIKNIVEHKQSLNEIFLNKNR